MWRMCLRVGVKTVETKTSWRARCPYNGSLAGPKKGKEVIWDGRQQEGTGQGDRRRGG